MRNLNEQQFDKFDYLVTKTVELGVEGAKIIDSSTVAVGECVRWKCQYGCPFYDKDSLHPPLAPSAEETKRVPSPRGMKVIVVMFGDVKAPDWANVIRISA